MRFSLTRVFSKTDPWLVGASLGLTIFGLLLISSLSQEGEGLLFKQALFLAVGLLMMLTLQIVDRHFWRNASVILYFIIIFLLLLVLFLGVTRQGTQGWFDFGFFLLQPAEAAKIIVVLFLATTLERLDFDIANWRHLLLIIAILALPVFFIAIQPDFGPILVILASAGAMIFFTGLSRKQLLAILLIILTLLAFSWFAILRDYQKQRIVNFLNPQADPTGAGYNVSQSIIAIGAGGFWGQGLGQGTQSQLNFLPEQTTDFIFASLAEELGFVGASAVIGLYVLFFWRLFLLMSKGADLFSSFFLLGIFSYFLTQTIVNIGMNMGLLPVVGVTLPFISYGGSSLIVSFAALGIAQGVRGER